MIIDDNLHIIHSLDDFNNPVVIVEFIATKNPIIINPNMKANNIALSKNIPIKNGSKIIADPSNHTFI